MKESPRRARVVVGLVDTHVAAPDHRRALPPERLGQPSGLRVVEEHAVTRADQRLELQGVALERPAIDLELFRPKRPAVALEPVQPVVDAPGDAEEVRTAANHHPARVDAGAAY